MRLAILPSVSNGLRLLALLLTSTAAWAVPGDEHWDFAFGLPGTTNYVYSLAQHNGQLYVGGRPQSGTNSTLFQFDGNQWTALGTFTHSTPTVYDLAFVGDTLYAGGYFTNVNGAPIAGLARWNGASWSSVGAFTGSVYAVTVSGGSLYVGGVFTNIGSVAATNVAYWDGSAWHALGNGLGRSGDVVLAVAINNGVLYAGGRFTNSGPSAVTNVARWSGSSWSAVGGGISAAGLSQVLTLAFKGSDLYAGGYFTQAGSTPANNIAKWDGANWSALNTGLNGSGATSLAVFNNQLCVAGQFTSAGSLTTTNFAIWDGASWAAPGVYMDGGGGSGVAYRAITAGTNLYLGGYFLVINSTFVDYVASWDGANWRAIGNPARMNGLSLQPRAVASDGSNLYVAGSFGWAGQVPALRVARWDGAYWHTVGGGFNNTVYALALVGTDLYAGGAFTTAGGVAANHIARWDGANWNAVGSGVPATVTALAAYNNNVLVGGNFQITASDRVATDIARWDGANWWSFGGFLFVADINGVGVDAILVNGPDVYLGGNFRASNSSSGLTSTNVVRFDGFDWQPMGGGAGGDVKALAMLNNEVYVAGQITNASGLPVNRIAKWNGSSWSSVGSGLTGTGSYSVNALAVINNNVYAAGSFTNASGLNVNRIAKWDLVGWSGLGNGVVYPAGPSATVYSLGAFGSDLYVGGIFTLAGNKPSGYLAHWNDTRNFDVAPALTLSKLRYSGAGFKFAVTATNVASYVIKCSTNLSVWTPVCTNTAGYYEYWDTTASASPRRFYRVQSGP